MLLPRSYISFPSGQKINIEGKGVTQTGLLAIVYKNTNEYLDILFTPEVESNAVYLSRTEGRKCFM